MHRQIELVALGDVHAPFHNRKALAWAIEQIRQLKPAYVVQMGDLLDQYGFSKHATNPNLMSPKEELAKGMKAAREMWAAIREASPKSQCLQISGNHDARIRKRVAEKLPELQDVLDLEMFDFPGVKCVNNDREYVRIVLPYSKTKVILTHGWFTQPGRHLAYFNESVLFGHLHRPSIVYEPQPKASRFSS